MGRTAGLGTWALGACQKQPQERDGGHSMASGGTQESVTRCLALRDRRGMAGEGLLREEVDLNLWEGAQ